MLSVYTHCYLIDIELYIHIMQQWNPTKEITEGMEQDITFHLHNMNIRHMNFLIKSQVAMRWNYRISDIVQQSLNAELFHYHK